MDTEHIASAVLDNIREAVYVLDLDMNILYINLASEQLTGRSLKAALGKKCWKIFGDEDLTCRDVCPIEKVIAEEHALAHHERELKTRDGQVRRMAVSISSLRFQERIEGATVIMDDITEFRRLEYTNLKTLIKLER